MGLQLTLQKTAEDAILTKAALCIAIDSYRDLQNSYGFAMRKAELFDISKALALIIKIDKTEIGGELTFTINDVLTLITSFDIALKLLRSKDPFRFIHAFKNDKPKRQELKLNLIRFCKEMLQELSEQAIYRSEVEEQKMLLADFVYD